MIAEAESQPKPVETTDLAAKLGETEVKRGGLGNLRKKNADTGSEQTVAGPTTDTPSVVAADERPVIAVDTPTPSPVLRRRLVTDVKDANPPQKAGEPAAASAGLLSKDNDDLAAKLGETEVKRGGLGNLRKSKAASAATSSDSDIPSADISGALKKAVADTPPKAADAPPSTTVDPLDTDTRPAIPGPTSEARTPAPTVEPSPIAERRTAVPRSAPETTPLVRERVPASTVAPSEVAPTTGDLFSEFAAAGITFEGDGVTGTETRSNPAALAAETRAMDTAVEARGGWLGAWDKVKNRGMDMMKGVANKIGAGEKLGAAKEKFDAWRAERALEAQSAQAIDRAQNMSDAKKAFARGLINVAATGFGFAAGYAAQELGGKGIANPILFFGLEGMGYLGMKLVAEAKDAEDNGTVNTAHPIMKKIGEMGLAINKKLKSDKATQLFFAGLMAGSLVNMAGDVAQGIQDMQAHAQTETPPERVEPDIKPVPSDEDVIPVPDLPDSVDKDNNGIADDVQDLDMDGIADSQQQPIDEPTDSSDNNNNNTDGTVNSEDKSSGSAYEGEPSSSSNETTPPPVEVVATQEFVEIKSGDTMWGHIHEIALEEGVDSPNGATKVVTEMIRMMNDDLGYDVSNMSVGDRLQVIDSNLVPDSLADGVNGVTLSDENIADLIRYADEAFKAENPDDLQRVFIELRNGDFQTLEANGEPMVDIHSIVTDNRLEAILEMIQTDDVVIVPETTAPSLPETTNDTTETAPVDDGKDSATDATTNSSGDTAPTADPAAPPELSTADETTAAPQMMEVTGAENITSTSDVLVVERGDTVSEIARNMSGDYETNVLKVLKFNEDWFLGPENQGRLTNAEFAALQDIMQEINDSQWGPETEGLADKVLDPSTGRTLLQTLDDIDALDYIREGMTLNLSEEAAAVQTKA